MLLSEHYALQKSLFGEIVFDDDLRIKKQQHLVV
jgi:hypothetical protein